MWSKLPILAAVETPDFFDADEELERPTRPSVQPPQERAVPARRPPAFWGLGERIAWVAGLVLALSAFMSWYNGESVEGPTVSVTGWNAGTLGKLVFVIGLAVLALAVLREVGVELPPAVPESLAVVALGALGTIVALIRLIDIPDTFAGSGRSIGIWIALLAAIAVIVAGLLRAAEEL